MAAETRGQAVARLLHNGGYVLAVGGRLEVQLPDRIQNKPQVIIWDDTTQNGIERKTLPSNVRAILTNKWVSHAISGRVREFARANQIPVFHMLSTREMKEILLEAFNEAPPTDIEKYTGTDDERAPEVIPETITPTAEQPPDKGYLTENEVGRQVKRGEYATTIFPKLLRDDETPAAATRRLMPIIKKEYGITTTTGALEQAIRHYRKTGGVVKPRSGPGRKVAEAPASDRVKSENMDFAEAKKLFQDAKATMDLAIEFINRLEKEMAAHRKRQEKLRDLLGD